MILHSKGTWLQIGHSQTASFTDTSAPPVKLLPRCYRGQPEVRECSCQGMLNNARTGDLSGTVSAVTVP
jgi:hypothetical protein